MAMLGLGDIVIPGLLASMCIRSDLVTAFREGKERALKDGVRNDLELVGNYVAKQMNCYYFYQSLIGYLLGMVATYSALNILKQAQPALLYILPSMTVVYILSAYFKRETIKMFFYDEDAELAT